MDAGKRPPGLYRHFQSTTLNQSLVVRRLGNWLLHADRLSLALGLAVAVAAYAGFTQYQGLAAAGEELSDLEGRF